MTDSPSSTVTEQVVPDSAAAPETEYLRLDPANLQAEIARLKAENQDFLRQYNTDVGNLAARKYQPQIQSRDAELEDLRKQLRRAEIEKMSEKDIEARFASDSSFASEYAELVHYKPQPKIDDPSPLIMEAWEEALDDARASGVTEDFIAKVTEKAAQGGYGSAGEHWARSINRVQKDLANEIIRIKTSPKDGSPASNSNLLKGGPDLTSGNRGSGSGYNFKSIAEFKARPTSEQMAILATPEGMAAVEELTKRGK